MKRLLMVQPTLDPPGGGNAVAAIALEALAAEYDVTLLIWRRPDLTAVDRYFGTRLAGANLTIVTPPSIARAVELTGLRAASFKRHALFRAARRIAAEFDVVVSMANEIDVGRTALQYVHYPWRAWPRPDYDLRWYHRPFGALAVYYALVQFISPASSASIARNLTLTNSAWTGRLYEHVYDAPWRVLHPPVAGVWTPRPWDARDDAFVIVGRISPEKEIERAIRIVRSLDRPIPLRVVGSIDDRRYHRQLRRSAGPDVTFHVDVPREQLLDLLGRTRYGIHCMEEEHFGIAIAEMLHSGCIPFVRAGGGAVEIVPDPRLTWSSDEEAVAKIGATIADSTRQEELRSYCAGRAGEFSVERFRRGLLDAVAEQAVLTQVQ
jgi:glycosyltransferase involved in cell wall biosynthesis